SGSFGPFIATSPSSGYGVTSSSLRSRRASRARNRLDRCGLTTGEQVAGGAGLARLADEGRAQRRREFGLEPLGPRLELGGGRAVRAKSRVDLEHSLVRDRRELRGAGEVVGELTPPRRERDGGLAAERLRRHA